MKILLSEFLINSFFRTDQNPRYSNLLRMQLADQRAVMVTLTRLPLVCHLVQREKEREGLQKSATGTLQSLIKFSYPCLTFRQKLENMLIFLLM